VVLRLSNKLKKVNLEDNSWIPSPSNEE